VEWFFGGFGNVYETTTVTESGRLQAKGKTGVPRSSPYTKGVFNGFKVTSYLADTCKHVCATSEGLVPCYVTSQASQYPWGSVVPSRSLRVVF
jgi:hypothetical protein